MLGREKKKEKRLKGKEEKNGKGENGWLLKIQLRIELSKSDKKQPLGRSGPTKLILIGLTAAGTYECICMALAPRALPKAFLHHPPYTCDTRRGTSTFACPCGVVPLTSTKLSARAYDHTFQPHRQDIDSRAEERISYPMVMDGGSRLRKPRRASQYLTPGR